MRRSDNGVALPYPLRRNILLIEWLQNDVQIVCLETGSENFSKFVATPQPKIAK